MLFWVNRFLKIRHMKYNKTCPNGHWFFKSSDCPACPICAEDQKPESGFLSTLSAPARRALENEGIFEMEQLAARTKAGILALHGVGPASIPTLQKAVQLAGLAFKQQ